MRFLANSVMNAQGFTFALELCACNACKVPVHNTWPYIGKELCLLPQKDVPVNYTMIAWRMNDIFLSLVAMVM